METAKVDIRKLQTLNDCINRTIEALNQVRLSVHGGLAHSAQMGLQGVGTPAFFGGYPGNFAGNFPGAFASPFGVAQGMVPSFQNVAGLTGGFPNAFATGVGLGHTAFDPRFGWDITADPYATARVAQTFPFVQWGQSPFAWPNV